MSRSQSNSLAASMVRNRIRQALHVSLSLVTCLTVGGLAAPALAEISLLNQWSTPQSNRCLAIGLDGTVYSGGHNSNGLDAYNHLGQTLSRIAPTGVSNCPGVTVDSSGNFYLADVVNNKVHKYNSSWVWQKDYATSTGALCTVGVDNNGTIYAGAWTAGVYRFNPDGSSPGNWINTVNSSYQYWQGVAQGTNGDLFVAGYGTNNLYQITINGAIKKTISDGAPYGIHATSAGFIYVGSESGNGAQKFDQNLNLLATFSTANTDDITAAPTGETYVLQGSTIFRYFDSTAWVSGNNTFTNASFGPTTAYVGTGTPSNKIAMGSSLALSSTRQLSASTIEVASGGSLSLNTGTLSASNLNIAGTFNYSAGTNSATLTTISSGGQLLATTSYPLNAGTTLTIAGGTLSTPDISATGSFVWSAGTVTLTGSKTFDASTPSALLAVNSGCSLQVANSATIAAGTSLSLSNGSFSATTLNIAGTFNYAAGTNNTILTTISPGGKLVATTAYPINSGTALILAGGTFATPNITGNGAFVWTSGTLSLTGSKTFDASTPSALLSVKSGCSLQVASDAIIAPNTCLTLQGGTLTASSLSIAGTLQNLDSTSLTLPAATTLAGGYIISAAGTNIPANMTFHAHGTILGPTSSNASSSIILDGPLTLGDAAVSDAILLYGSLAVGSYRAVLMGQNHATLGASTTINGGSLAAPNGAQLLTGQTLSGFGTINDDFQNHGLVAGGTANNWLTFTGLVSGAGSYTGNVSFTGTFSPGNSPASVTLENMTMDPACHLLLELAGTTPGAQYDTLSFTHASLNGTLDIHLLNDFSPTAGQSFHLFNGDLAGRFIQLNLPSLAPTLAWDTTQLTTTGILSVDAVPEPSTLLLLAVSAGSCCLRRRPRF